jgi:hypothetical protein
MTRRPGSRGGDRLRQRRVVNPVVTRGRQVRAFRERRKPMRLKRKSFVLASSLLLFGRGSPGGNCGERRAACRRDHQSGRE